MQIAIFGKIARILNRGNRIVVDERGVEENVPFDVKAGWYSGLRGDYQKRITAPWLVEPLLAVANGLRMQLSIMKPHRINGDYCLVCVIGRGLISGTGYCRLNIAGLTHNQKEAMEIILQAAREAKENYDATVLIMADDKRYPTLVEAPKDRLAGVA
jgi:hypothetical protein